MVLNFKAVIFSYFAFPSPHV